MDIIKTLMMKKMKMQSKDQNRTMFCKDNRHCILCQNSKISDNCGKKENTFEKHVDISEATMLIYETCKIVFFASYPSDGLKVD